MVDYLCNNINVYCDQNVNYTSLFQPTSSKKMKTVQIQISQAMHCASRSLFTNIAVLMNTEHKFTLCHKKRYK